MAKKLTIEVFKHRSNSVHNNFYIYDASVYKNRRTKISIICPHHGEFKQLPSAHMDGHMCSKCSGESRSIKSRTNINDFIKISSLLHNNRYDYSKVLYKNNRVKVKIICEKHGEFEQRPFCHLKGHGCPSCKESMGEKKIATFLNMKKIEYIRGWRFKDCVYKNPLPFDFYIPKYNLCVEYDGVQHFKGWYRKEISLEDIKFRDSIKTDYCKSKFINLIRISYKDYNYVESILNSSIKGL